MSGFRDDEEFQGLELWAMYACAAVFVGLILMLLWMLYCMVTKVCWIIFN